MVPYAHTNQDGYDHVTSKSILPGTDKFCGLLLDQINQDDMTDSRIESWIEQLQLGGFFESNSSNESSLLSKATAALTIDDDDDDILMIDTAIRREVAQAVVEQSPISANNFTPHYNPVTGRTMWTSLDGRSSYVTTSTKTGLGP
jgi:hypothetical protein